MLVLIDEIVGWRAGLDDLLARFAHRFGRAEPRRQALSYLVGLLSPLASKNGWTLAEAAGDTTPDRMQRLLDKSAWDPDAVRDDLFAYVSEHLGHDDGVLIVDETGFLKKGIKSAGVQRQYSGTAGRTEKLPTRGIPGLRQPTRAQADRPGAVSAPRLVRQPRPP